MTLQLKPSTPVGLRHRLWRNKRGNIAIITALMMIPLTFALGMAYDFTMAESRQDQINGMADVATLGGVTPTMMAKSNAAAQSFSENLFTSQLATVNGVTYNVSDIDMTGSGDNASGTSVTRTIEITYKAASVNVFAKLLGMPTFPLHGKSIATSATAPNIDFYLMMDTSPSMEIAATSAGIATMIANTQQESDGTTVTDTWTKQPAIYTTGGKFFGSPNGRRLRLRLPERPGRPDVRQQLRLAHRPERPWRRRRPTACKFLTSPPARAKIPCTVAGAYADGTTFTTASTFPKTGRDNYDLSRCSLAHHPDRDRPAQHRVRRTLMDAAARLTAANDNAVRVYPHGDLRDRLQQAGQPAERLYTFPLQALTSDLSAAKTKAATLTSLEMCKQQSKLACGGDSNNDMATPYLDSNLTVHEHRWIMPTPGNGTNNAGDTPQGSAVHRH